MQIALATCMAMSIVLSLIAVLKHYKNKNLKIFEIKYYLVFLVVGYILGSIIVKHIDTVLLKYIFSIILFISGLWMVFHNDSQIMNLPVIVKYPITVICGVMSTLASSSTFVTLLFVKTGMDIKKAIINISFCVLVSSLIGILLLVYGINIDIPNTFGYISVPILAASIPFSVIGSLLAVRYLGVISPKLLKNMFIILMFISSVIMML